MVHTVRVFYLGGNDMQKVRVQNSTLQIINSHEVKAIKDWEEICPDAWLFIEVTREDIWEVYEGKLVAIAEDPMEFLEIDREYNERGIITLTTKGSTNGELPAVVPTFSVINA